MIVTGAGPKGPWVVRRVLGLLADFRAATRPPWDGAASARLAEARRSGTARRDLVEIRERMERLKSLHPELSVETGPLLGLAGEYVDTVETRLVTRRRPAAAGVRGAAR